MALINRGHDAILAGRRNVVCSNLITNKSRAITRDCVHGILDAAAENTASDVGCAGGSAKPPIEAQVIACHHVGGEPLLEHPAHCPAVELIKLEDRPYGFVFGVHNEPGFAVVNDLGRRTRSATRSQAFHKPWLRSAPDQTARANRSGTGVRRHFQGKRISRRHRSPR